ncbi:hypothetical protein FORMA_13270 [Formosa sp. Hel3_A1_48]|uniref:hypothetical protein n=1 Tax=Formosa sp. Hel3_A1_48 TaxID=1336795 RepID=UPI00084E1A95|nr:hypothetical protein [Formosa sp. Hel3_A1_48]AOR26486.1 hypothetical protein FORMA_13270 [Formosa sp. Hel3_A1_48]MDC0950760.1 hypothetical protein [Flavobacteriaceae bacterium]
MKKQFLLTLFFAAIIQVNAQSNQRTDRVSLLTVGVNAIDNSNKGVIPNDFNQIDFSSPLFLQFERRLERNWSLALSLSTNKLDSEISDQDGSYNAVDLSANYFIDKYLFKNTNIDLYLGVGFGIHIIDEASSETLNLIGGTRYWFSNRLGLSLQLISKVGEFNDTAVTDVGNHHQFSAGLVFNLTP